VGGQVLRLDAQDPELASLLSCSIPIVVSGSALLGEAPQTWNFDYLDRHLSDVDMFYVLAAPADSKQRFAYYDMAPKKNPCGYDVKPTNTRVEMRFPEFRRKVFEANKRRRAGKKASSYYLQNVLLHRQDQEPGGPKPVGGFGINCGFQIAKDMEQFRWNWLQSVMGGRHVQMCQFFCGTPGGFSPCHYDPQDNMFAQVRGYKRVLLFHPRHFGCLYPWPVHHPQDRQSRVDFENPDLNLFPRFAELQGQGIEAVLGPGDILRIPPGWWHHIEMLPSAQDDEVVSINFWYTPPTWFYGDLHSGNIYWDKPLFGVRRVFFMRSIEELVGQTDPAEVHTVLGICAGVQTVSAQNTKLEGLIQTVESFVTTVFPDPKERCNILLELLEGRFCGLTPNTNAGIES